MDNKANEGYYHWDEDNTMSYKNRMGFYKTNQEWEFIFKNVRKHLPPKSNILDIGGGSGRFARRLINNGFNVLIVDINNTAIEIAKKKGLNAVCADFLKEFDSSQKYDCIVCIEVLLYVEDKKLFFKKASKLLNNNGLIIFTATNPYSWRYWLRTFKSKRFKYYEQGLSKYEKMMAANDLSVLSRRGFMWLPFSLTSNSSLIPFFAALEKYLFLPKIMFQSPWWLFSAQKQ